MKEYKISLSGKILLGLLCSLLGAGALAALMVLLFRHNTGVMLWAWCPVCLALLVMSVLGLLDVVRTKFTIDADKFTYQSALRYHTLYFEETKGFRRLTRYILIVPAVPGKKAIRIHQYLQGREDIIQWLSHHFPDIDVVEANDEKQALLENRSFGASVKEREHNLRRARKTARLVNGTGIVTAAWVFLMGRPYDISIFVLMLYPLVALAVIIRFRGLVRIHQRERSIYPNLIWSFIYPCMSLCLRALIDFNIFRYNGIWLPCALITAVLLAVLLLASREYHLTRFKDYISIAGLALFLFAYSYGLIVCLNCEYDRSTPEHYMARVLDKHISKGKTTTYYLDLAPWGPQKEEDQVDVPSRFYDQVSVNDEVPVRFKKGRFRIPWFIIGKE